MRHIVLSVAIPLIIFYAFIFLTLLAFSGGWSSFLEGNFQCDVNFGSESFSMQHRCGYAEFFSETVELAYGFFISGWWIAIIGAAVVMYGGFYFIKYILL